MHLPFRKTRFLSHADKHVNSVSIKTHQYPQKSPKTKDLISPENPLSCFQDGLKTCTGDSSSPVLSPGWSTNPSHSCVTGGTACTGVTFSSQHIPCTLVGQNRTPHAIPKGPGLILHPNQHLNNLFPPEDKIVAPPHLRGFKKYNSIDYHKGRLNNSWSKTLQ